MPNKSIPTELKLSLINTHTKAHTKSSSDAKVWFGSIQRAFAKPQSKPFASKPFAHIWLDSHHIPHAWLNVYGKRGLTPNTDSRPLDLLFQEPQDRCFDLLMVPLRNDQIVVRSLDRNKFSTRKMSLDLQSKLIIHGAVSGALSRMHLFIRWQEICKFVDGDSHE